MFPTSSDRSRILPRFCFVAGGIEVSFPISHSPTRTDTVLYAIDRTEQRVYVTWWRTGITLWHAMVGRILTGYGR